MKYSINGRVKNRTTTWAVLNKGRRQDISKNKLKHQN